MALTDDNNLIMPVAPMNGGGGFGNFGNGDGWWVLILFLLLGNGGWGNGYGGNDGLYPWMNQADITNSGFQNLATQNQLTAVQSDLGDIQAQLCNGFAGVNATVNSGFSAAEIANNGRQMANMQQAFNSQTAITGAITGLGSQLADCCCEQRLGTCQTQNIIQNEGNATRFADANNTRDIVENANRNSQAILDKLCSLELDAKNDTIAQLRQELMFARGQASQDVQTLELKANNAITANELLAEMRSCPIPAQPVYGSQPIFTCNSGCGCGNNF